jgi:serine/threonine-protein kinase
MAMSEDPRVDEALEGMLGSGLTPEEACAGCPDILPEVRRRWEQMRRVREELDQLFPPAPPAEDNGASG